MAECDQQLDENRASVIVILGKQNADRSDGVRHRRSVLA
jgi:hypothetical protein